jgi:transcriptional regulator with XRE-family HTH domain
MAQGKEGSVISSQFPSRLKGVRKQRGLTQGQLSKRIGADVQRVSRYERGLLVPTTELLAKIAEVLDVSMDYLVRNGEDRAMGRVRDRELVDLFVQVDGLPEKDRGILKQLIEAFVKKHRFEELARE